MKVKGLLVSVGVVVVRIFVVRSFDAIVVVIIRDLCTLGLR